MENTAKHPGSQNTVGRSVAGHIEAVNGGTSDMRIPEPTRLFVPDSESPQIGEKEFLRYRNDLPPFAQSKKTGNLPDNIQAKMERSFGQDFSDVQVFKNSDLAKNMDAAALTQHNDIHFAPGYDPYAAEGASLLGHELSHVVQQRQGRVMPTHYEGGMGINDANDLEKEADVHGQMAARGELINTGQGGTRYQPTMQKKSSVVQMWRPLPGQARVESVEPYVDDAWRAVRGAIGNAANAWVDDIDSEFRAAFIGRLTEELRGNLGTITINNFKTYSGLNLTWRGDIQFKIDGIRQIGGGGIGSTVMGTGGSTTTGISETETETGGTTGGATLSQSPGSGGGTGGSVTGGVSSGTTSARTDSASHTSNATNSSTVSQVLTRYRASLACFVTLSAESSVGDSGWDYVNPFQWGVALGNAITGDLHGSASINCGTVTYYMGNGIAP